MIFVSQNLHAADVIGSKPCLSKSILNNIKLRSFMIFSLPLKFSNVFSFSKVFSGQLKRKVGYHRLQRM